MTPIVLIHKGNSWYLPYTIWQLKKTNPNTNLYLLGTNNTKHLNKWIKHIDITTYNHSTNQINAVYKHHSNLGPEFELTCIERWFVLTAFMKDLKLQQCIYLDSDILVYTNLNKIKTNFVNYNMTWCGFSAHTNFINNIVALENYCNNVIDCYNNKFPSELKEKCLFNQVMTGKKDMNISDMTFFHDYNLRYPNSLLDISLPNTKGTFDRSMEDTRVFEKGVDGFKKIYWKAKQPYCKEIESGKLTPFVTLHFQGKGKNILKKYFNTFSISFFHINYLSKINSIITKIGDKISI